MVLIPPGAQIGNQVQQLLLREYIDKSAWHLRYVQWRTTFDLVDRDLDRSMARWIGPNSQPTTIVIHNATNENTPILRGDGFITS